MYQLERSDIRAPWLSIECAPRIETRQYWVGDVTEMYTRRKVFSSRDCQVLVRQSPVVTIRRPERIIRDLKMNSPKRVLLVEDFEDSRTGLRKLLEIEGYEVIEAADGARAIEAALTLRPDIILMDLSLPVIDGFIATRRIKQDAAMRGVPIIALSAHDVEDVQSLVTSAGCADFVTKPVDFSVLLTQMAKYLPN